MFSLYLLFTSIVIFTSWKVFTNGVFSGPYFPVFERNTGKYGSGETSYRSSHRRCSVKKGVLRNFAKFTEKHLCQSPLFNKVAGLKSATLIKKRHWHVFFPLNFAKFLRTPFYRTPLGDCFCPYLNTFHSVLFTFTCLFLFTLIYPYLCSFILLYEFDKIDKIWEI